MFGTTLVIGPQPLDQTYTFQLVYLKEPTELTDTTGRRRHIRHAQHFL
jgi:hypothetical protein